MRKSNNPDPRIQDMGKNKFVNLAINLVISIIICSVGFTGLMFYTNNIFSVDEDSVVSLSDNATTYTVVNADDQSVANALPGVQGQASTQTASQITNGKEIDTSKFYTITGLSKNSFPMMGWHLIGPSKTKSGQAKPTGSNQAMLRFKYYPNWDKNKDPYRQGNPDAYDPSDHIGRIEGRYTVAVTCTNCKVSKPMNKIDHGLVGENVGQELDVYLDDGTMLPCIIADEKGDGACPYGHPGGGALSIIEFVVDGSYYYSGGANNPRPGKKEISSPTWFHPEWSNRKVVKIVRGKTVKY